MDLGETGGRSGPNIGGALARPAYEWTLDEGVERLASGAPDELAVLADPAYALRGARLAAETPGLLLRPVRLGGRPMALLCSYSHDASHGVRARALAFEAADIVAEGAAFFSRAPAMFGPSAAPDAPSDDDAAAARASLSALLRPRHDAARPSLGGQTASFWGRLSAFAALSPRDLLPLISAVSGIEGARGVLFDAAQRKQTQDQREAPGLGALAHAQLGPDLIAARWPIEPGDAPGRFLDSLRAAAAALIGAPFRFDELERFLAREDAEPPEAPVDAQERALQLARICGAAESAAADQPDAVLNAPLSPVGSARAAGLIAIEAEEESGLAWEALAQFYPSRAYWSILALAQPQIDEPIGLRTLTELARIFAIEDRIRAALPEGAPTPLDAPRFRRLALEFLERIGPESLSADPELTLDAKSGGPAPWLVRLADLWAEVGDKPKRILASTIDAIETAVTFTEDRRAWSRSMRVIRSHTLSGGRLDEQTVGKTWIAHDFARRTSRAIQLGSWRGAVFWRRALAALLADMKETAPNEYGDTERSLRQRLNAEQRPSDASALRLLGGAPPPRAVKTHMDADAPPLNLERLQPAPKPETPTGLERAVGTAEPEAQPADADADAPQPEPAAEDAAADAATEPEAKAPMLAPRRPKPGGKAAPVDDEALEAASLAAQRWRARYAEILSDRQSGAKHETISFSAKGEEEADAEALETLAACVASGVAGPNAELLDRAIGADLAWTTRQLLGLRLRWSERGAHPPAPEPIRLAWRTIAYADQDADLQTEEMFFLFFASKLLQRAEREGRDADAFTEPMVKLLPDLANPFATGGGERVTVSPYKGWLRDYVYLAKRKETGQEIDALDDEAVLARLDRILFFLALVTCRPADLRPEAPTALWDPIFRNARGEARALDAPLIARGRLERYFRSGDPISLAYAHAFEKITTRHQQFQLDDIAPLNRLVKRMRQAQKGGKNA
ncbi:MAG: hypothetical protein MRY74_04845 [Neomegalonema sp.]|nr:hypothetical protein [Neomegalonema sp.]